MVHKCVHGMHITPSHTKILMSNRCHTYRSSPEKTEEKNEEQEAHHVKFKMRIWQKWDNNTPKDKVGQDNSTCTSLFIKKKRSDSQVHISLPITNYAGREIHLRDLIGSLHKVSPETGSLLDCFSIIVALQLNGSPNLFRPNSKIWFHIPSQKLFLLPTFRSRRLLWVVDHASMRRYNCPYL